MKRASFSSVRAARSTRPLVSNRLFLPAEGGKIVLCFLPQQVISSYQIGRPIGEMLVEEKLASKDEVQAALERQHLLRTQRIGDFLAENEIVSREQLAQAIRHQESRRF